MIGILPSNVLQNGGAIRRAALLFDELILWPFDPAMEEEERLRFNAEREWLISEGVARTVAPILPINFFVPETPAGSYSVDILMANSMSTRFWPADAKTPEGIIRGAAAYLRLTGQADAIPVSTTTYAHQAGADTVVQVMLPEVPSPAEDTPWESIIDFRNDPDARHAYSSLRAWIRRLAHSDYTAAEIRDELRHCLAEYDRFMRLHRMSTRMSGLQLLVVGTASLLENLIKLRLTAVAQSLFSFSERRIQLAQAEMVAPGHELAYILKARERFDS